MRQRLYIIAGVLALVMAFQAVSLGARLLGDRLFPSAFAQPTAIEAVNLKRGIIKYTWTEGVDGPATELRLKCGPNSGQYTFTRIITPVASTGTIALTELLPKSGLWYCAIAGANKFGEGPLSAELPFDAGAIPSGLGSLSWGSK
jgi:hypothetical protein